MEEMTHAASDARCASGIETCVEEMHFQYYFKFQCTLSWKFNGKIGNAHELTNGYRRSAPRQPAAALISDRALHIA